MGRSADQERVGPLHQDSVDDTGCRFLHVDMDAFFANVEVRRDPSLRGRPVIVGGSGGRGVVASASYEARRFGVRSAMSMSRALALCPGAVVVPGRHEDYGAVSAQVMAILRDITPLVQPLSLDEAFLDVAGAVRLLGSPEQIARLIRERVECELELTCSVGVAARMFVAKIASTRCKPDGLLVVPAADTLEFLYPLPVSALWGVGPTTARRLVEIGLHTVGDLAHAREQTLISNLGRATAAHLQDLAAGRDPRQVTPERSEKSVSAEETFFFALTDHETIESEIGRLAQKVGRRLRDKGIRARGVAVKLRTADFDTLTRSVLVAEPTDVGRVIGENALALWRAAERTAIGGRPIRLIGVRAHALLDAGSPAQLALEPDDSERWSQTERAMDTLNDRFGRDAVRPAAALGRRSRSPSAGPPAEQADPPEARTEFGRPGTQPRQ